MAKITRKSVERLSDELLQEAKREPYYNDRVWKFYDEVSDKTYKFEFDENIFREHIDYIKTYIYYRTQVEFAYTTVHNEFGILRRVAQNTFGFRLMDEELLFESDSGERRASALESYFSFIGFDVYDVEMMIQEHRRKSTKLGRRLAEMETLLTMDGIIDDYFHDAHGEDMRYYFPVILWWKIGGVIPTRTSEFCIIRYNCLRRNGWRYQIEMPTVKEQQQRDVSYTWLTIDRGLFEVIDTYRNLVRDKRQYLLSEKEYKKRNPNRKHRKHINSDDFRTLLDQFYTEIVHERFGYTVVPKGEKKNPEDIEKIAPMDLRHMAMCTMCLQGIDPITIMKMARHKRVTQQSHYINNAMPYAMSRITIFAQRIKLRLKGQMYSNVRRYDEGAFDDRNREVQLIRNEQQDGVPIDNGRCVSTTPMLNCPTDECAPCPYYLPNDIDDGEEERIKKMLDLEIADLAAAVDSMKLLYRLGQVDGLKELGQQVEACINRSAMLKARAELLEEGRK